MYELFGLRTQIRSFPDKAVHLPLFGFRISPLTQDHRKTPFTGFSGIMTGKTGNIEYPVTAAKSLRMGPPSGPFPILNSCYISGHGPDHLLVRS